MQKKLLCIGMSCGKSLKMLFFFISLYMMSSCADDDCLAPGHSDEGNSCPATLLLEVGGFSAAMSPQTKVVAGADDENLINDIWVFQFNAITGESLHEPVYIDRDNNLNANDILVNLAQNGEGEQSRICIVANTGDENWVYEGTEGTVATGFTTYAGFLEQAIPDKAAQPFLSADIGSSAENGRTIPMFGISKDMTISSKCYVSVPLYRMFARVDVGVDISYIPEGMYIENLSYSNIPAYCRVGTVASQDESQQGDYPTDIEWKTFDCGNVSEAILYVPENLQGKVEGMTSKQEIAGEIPTNALTIHLEVSYGENLKHTYTVYPGLDAANDFNIKRNHIYDVNLIIRELPETTH